MTPHITRAAVTRIAELARLHLTDEELAAAAQTLQGVLQHFSAIQNVATDNIPTADNMTGLTNVARADVARPEAWCTAAELLAAAPSSHDGQIQVRAVFGG